jgi:uncharacterized membrane protein HdeD (DUF308 family)
MNEISDAMRAPSRIGTVLGIATIVFGILAMMMPMLSGITVAAIVAVLLIAGGIARTAFAFKAGSFGKGLLMFLFGGLSVLVGAIMLARPLLGLKSLTMVLVAYFIVDGIFEIMAGFKLKGVRGWFWFVIGGIASLVLALLIWRQWPASGQWAIGLLIGIRLIFAGWEMVAVGAVGEAVVDEIESQAR